MLGHMVVERLGRDAGLAVEGVTRSEFDAERPDFAKLPPCDYVVNAIGVLRAEIDESRPASLARAIRVNAVFPHELADWAKTRGVRVLHFSTDAVFANDREACFEDSPKDATDPYGQSKALGEPRAEGCLVLRGSIVGPDPARKRGLLEWFLAQPEGSSVKGFTNQTWHGVTTLEFAELCRRVIVEERFDALRAESSVHHLCLHRPLSKYELLRVFQAVHAKKVTIVPHEGPPVRRVLATRFRGLEGLSGRDLPLEDAVRAMRK